MRRFVRSTVRTTLVSMPRDSRPEDGRRVPRERTKGRIAALAAAALSRAHSNSRRPNRPSLRVQPASVRARARQTSARVPRPRCLCAPYSSPGNKPGDHHEAQKERWSVGHNPNKSQEFPAKESNGGRILPGRPSLPGGKAYSALVSSNRVPERTADRQN